MSRNKYPEETVNLILDVSLKLFLEKGYEHTTVQDIIDNLGGLTKGAIYHHFQSKEEILSAVSDRLFQDNTLSKKWEKTKRDKNLSGGEKIRQMLSDAITDEQEQKFRALGVHLPNMPQFLSDLLLRSVCTIAPEVFQPVIEEGIADGSISFPHAKALAELIALIANIWINPLVFQMTDEELHNKFDCICDLLKPTGLNLSDLYPTLEKMNQSINE